MLKFVTFEVVSGYPGQDKVRVQVCNITHILGGPQRTDGYTYFDTCTIKVNGGEGILVKANIDDVVELMEEPHETEIYT